LLARIKVCGKFDSFSPNIAWNGKSSKEKRNDRRKEHVGSDKTISMDKGGPMQVAAIRVKEQS
jgi:hypothetical protein